MMTDEYGWKIMYKYEKELNMRGIKTIAGVDEAGRGPLAGPVVAAAVILPSHMRIDGINDSKKISVKKREKLYSILIEEAHIGIGIIDERLIDEINIYQAARLAMKNAVLDLGMNPEYLLIDGTMTVDLEIESLSIIKGDTKSASIAAASIIAKVVRDEIMRELHIQYPHYGFDVHKGYPTKQHIEALELYGPASIHRCSFGPVKRLLV